jgi:hypothetical protein
MFVVVNHYKGFSFTLEQEQNHETLLGSRISSGLYILVLSSKPYI